MKDYGYGYGWHDGYGWHKGEAPFSRLEQQAGEGEAAKAVVVKGVGGAARGADGAGWKEEIRRWGMPFDVDEAAGYPDGVDGRRTPTPTVKEEAYAGGSAVEGGSAGAYKGGAGEVVAGVGAGWRATPAPAQAGVDGRGRTEDRSAQPPGASAGNGGAGAGWRATPAPAQAGIDGRGRTEDRSAQPPGASAGNGGAGAGNWWVQQDAAKGEVEAKGDIDGRERTEDRSVHPPGATGHAEDPYERMYRLLARESPKAPDYRREKAERMGAMLSSTFKLLADAAMVGLDASGKGSLMYGHQVGPDNLTERLAAVSQREASREEQHRQEVRETESYNKQLALALYKMRRDDELAEARSKEAQRQHAEKMAMEAQQLSWEAAKLGHEQQHEINKLNAKHAQEWAMHKDKTAVDAYNAETARKKADSEIGGKGKPYTTYRIDLNDGRGEQLVPLEEGDVSSLFSFLQQRELKKTGEEEKDIKIVIDAYRHNGSMDKQAVNRVLAKYAGDPDVVRRVRTMVYGSGAGKGAAGAAVTNWAATGGMYRPGAGKKTSGAEGAPMMIFRN
jgi:hypothetical protein